VRRYQLSDEKTFESLFHPQKDNLLRLTDHFLHKTGCTPPAPCKTLDGWGLSGCRCGVPHVVLLTGLTGWRHAQCWVWLCHLHSLTNISCVGVGSLRSRASSTSWACCCTARLAPGRPPWSRCALASRRKKPV
jgi:hypothetical protein